MHYIIGTSFDVHEIVRGSTDKLTLERNRYLRFFPEPGAYELYYIRRTPERLVEYTFYNRSTGNKYKHEFKTTGEADRIISTLIGESLPDYSRNYEEMSD
jgi:hypothetical protein